MLNSEHIERLRQYKFKYPGFDYEVGFTITINDTILYVDESDYKFLTYALLGRTDIEVQSTIQDKAQLMADESGRKLPFIRDYEHLENLEKILNILGAIEQDEPRPLTEAKCHV